MEGLGEVPLPWKNCREKSERGTDGKNFDDLELGPYGERETLLMIDLFYHNYNRFITEYQ